MMEMAKILALTAVRSYVAEKGGRRRGIRSISQIIMREARDISTALYRGCFQLG
jgi:hypothetical protein